MNELSPARQAFQNHHGSGAGKSPAWLSALREEGLQSFLGKGFPTQRQEDWKYTGLQALEKISFSTSPAETPGKKPGENIDLRSYGASGSVYFVNGRMIENESDKVSALADMLNSDGDALESLLGSSKDGAVLTSLNTALMEDGFVIDLKGEALDRIIEIHHIAVPGSDMTAFHPRNFIVADANSRATIVEFFQSAGDGGYLSNAVTEIRVENGSSINHIRIFEDSFDAYNLIKTNVQVGADSSYANFTLATGAKVLRNEIHVALNAPGAETALNGIYLAAGKQHSDHTTLIEHNAPNTTSKEFYRGALDGSARGVFQGNIRVAKGADQSNGDMRNNTLLLSDKAEIDSKPQLEIYADDVKCSHGATTGELDEEALFYLRSRGIPEDSARALLVEGFLSVVIEEIEDPQLADMCKSRIIDWLSVDRSGPTGPTGGAEA